MHHLCYLQFLHFYFFFPLGSLRRWGSQPGCPLLLSQPPPRTTRQEHQPAADAKPPPAGKQPPRWLLGKPSPRGLSAPPGTRPVPRSSPRRRRGDKQDLELLRALHRVTPYFRFWGKSGSLRGGHASAAARGRPCLDGPSAAGHRGSPARSTAGASRVPQTPQRAAAGPGLTKGPRSAPLFSLRSGLLLLSAPARGKTIKTPLACFSGTGSSPCSSPPLRRTANKPEPNTPVTPSHRDLPPTRAHGSAPPEAQLPTPGSFAEEPQTFLQPEKLQQARELLGTPGWCHTLCFSLQIMAWIHRRDV